MGSPTVIEFFAGSGLVTSGLKSYCSVLWANDICSKKAQVYCKNHGASEFQLDDLCNIEGVNLPKADISWASFPCQDLSLAGNMKGIQASRSGMFWEWLRVIDEMPHKPKVLCLENVVGLVSTRGGADYRTLHHALEQRGYRVGPMLLDAVHWLPQSRRRIFVVAVQHKIDSSYCEDAGPNWAHPPLVQKACVKLQNVVWWNIPNPNRQVLGLSDIIEWNAPCFEGKKKENLFNLIPERHRKQIEHYSAFCDRAVFPGYRRTRKGKQVLELRFDNVSGCLRTAEGGSSRQFVVIWNENNWSVRLITVREAARLMGASDSYWLSDVYNDSYTAMGDAVAVPVVEFLAKNLLSVLAKRKATETKSLKEFALQA